MGERNGWDNRWCPRCLWLREKCICKRPTVLTMDGETGEDYAAEPKQRAEVLNATTCRWRCGGQPSFHTRDLCPAPTPRAKP